MYKSTSASGGASGGGEMKYKGVRKRKWGKYVSEIRLPNSRERIWLGSYDAAEKAARAFDAAIFCLRGPAAKLNFPADPPDIAGWQSLTNAEIQAIAHHYGNTYPTPPPMPPTTPPRQQLDDTSPSSNSDEAEAEAGPIDWSFLDVLDSTANAGHVSDFGLFHDPGDMYVAPHLPERDDGEESANLESTFLWNF